MRDNHLHTHFSYDSDAQFEDYLDHYTGDIVTTDRWQTSERCNTHASETRLLMPSCVLYNVTRALHVQTEQ